METGPSSQRDRLLQVAADHQSACSSLSQRPGHQVESGFAAASISGSEGCESSLFRLLTEDALSPLSLYGPLLPSSLPLFVSPHHGFVWWLSFPSGTWEITSAFWTKLQMCLRYCCCNLLSEKIQCV